MRNPMINPIAIAIPDFCFGCFMNIIALIFTNILILFYFLWKISYLPEVAVLNVDTFVSQLFSIIHESFHSMTNSSVSKRIGSQM